MTLQLLLVCIFVSASQLQNQGDMDDKLLGRFSGLFETAPMEPGEDTGDTHSILASSKVRDLLETPPAGPECIGSSSSILDRLKIS